MGCFAWSLQREACSFPLACIKPINSRWRRKNFLILLIVDGRILSHIAVAMGAVNLADVQRLDLFAFFKLKAMTLPATGRAIHFFVLIMAVAYKCKHLK
ncbi:hypothetical protein SY85_23100 [Flavisolibacter tropicus]|uniref:Uncharacterized protein n=1 Tax=Flavisolibacter tropicus TaxID=1492898 RepID=A0A172U1N0_9BACT|nr:hypothetical protein SY85_23100 [Flavisolibacter tropicus]